jgi:hypothetical protein
VLVDHLDLPNVLGTAEQVKMFCMRQQESTSVSGRKTRVDKELANATAFLDYTVWFVIEPFSTQSFHFKIKFAQTPNVASSSRAAQVNPFNVMMQAHTNFTFLPPLLTHERMYANHDLYNELIGFLEQNSRGWTKDSSFTTGKRFIDCMSKSVFQCGPPMCDALNNKHTNGKACLVADTIADVLFYQHVLLLRLKIVFFCIIEIGRAHV